MEMQATDRSQTTVVKYVVLGSGRDHEVTVEVGGDGRLRITDSHGLLAMGGSPRQLVDIMRALITTIERDFLMEHPAPTAPTK